MWNLVQYCLVGVALVLSATGVQAAEPPILDKTGWTVQVDSFESQKSQNGTDYRGDYAIDNSPALMWHTQFAAATPPHPHTLDVNMQRVVTVSGIRYLPRQDSDSGRIIQYEVLTSLDGRAWGVPAATGTWANTPSAQTVTFTPRSAQYLRLRALSAVAGVPYACVLELDVLGVAEDGPPADALRRIAWEYPRPASLEGFLLEVCTLLPSGCAWQPTQMLAPDVRETRVQVPPGTQKCFQVWAYEGVARAGPTNVLCLMGPASVPLSR
jgi:hypothetical protein